MKASSEIIDIFSLYKIKSWKEKLESQYLSLGEIRMHINVVQKVMCNIIIVYYKPHKNSCIVRLKCSKPMSNGSQVRPPLTITQSPSLVYKQKKTKMSSLYCIENRREFLGHGAARGCNLSSPCMLCDQHFIQRLNEYANAMLG